MSDILTFFRIATYCLSLRWAPTSNVMVRGDAARAERFRTVFPKGGGGEDIDYLLRVSDRAGLPLLAAPSESVNHPWWFDGARDYTRFTRWSFGDSLLHDLHPRFTYRAAPNAVELLALAVPLLAMQVRRRCWRAITERWDHFCDGEHVAYHKRSAALKLSAHLGAAAFVGCVGLFIDLW